MTSLMFFPLSYFSKKKRFKINKMSAKRWMHALFVLSTICISTLAPAQTFDASDPPFAISSSTALFMQDVTYGPHQLNKLDIFLPTPQLRAKRPTPLVVFIHGGGFSSGSKENAYKAGNQGDIITLLKQGVAYASINYPLLEQNDQEGLIKPLNGVKRALQFLRLHRSEFNIDPDRIVLLGNSAGASAALWLAFHDELADLNSRDPVERQSSRVLAAVVTETQSSMDIVRWEQVFQNYDFSVSELEEGERFYGIDNLQQLFSPKIVDYRQELDLLRLMDSGDPEIWVNNESVPVTAPTNTSVLYHHPYHAKALRDQAAKVGLRGSFYIPRLSIMPAARESMISFILRKVQ